MNIINKLSDAWVPFLRLKRRAKRDVHLFATWTTAFKACQKDTIYCIGNGPSLKNQDLAALDGQFCLLTNRAYQLLDRFNPSESFTVFSDIERILEVVPNLKKARPLERILFSVNRLDRSALQCAELLSSGCFLMPKAVLYTNRVFPRVRVDLADGFSGNIESGLYTGHSVIFTAIQIAAALGARRIVCLGIDMNYSGDPGKDYLVPGVTNLFNFNYEVHARDMFIFQRDALLARGVKLLNATPGGRVDVLERVAI